MDALFNSLLFYAAIALVLWFAFAWGVEVGKGRAQNERYREREEEAQRKERASSEPLELGDAVAVAVAEGMPSAQKLSKKQPSSKDFWRAQGTAQGSQSPEAELQQPKKTPPTDPEERGKASLEAYQRHMAKREQSKQQAQIHLPRIVPVSYPKLANESAEKQTRYRMLLEVLTAASKPLPVAITLDGLLPSQETLIEISVVEEKWQPLVEFAEKGRRQAQSGCDLKLLLQPVRGISVKGDFSFVMETQCSYGPVDRDGYCDAFALKDGTRLPFVQGLSFESSLDGALAAFFIQVALPGHWAWGHGKYDRDQKLVMTLDAAIAILEKSKISPENSQLRELTIPPGIRVSRRGDTIEVGCLTYRPGKGFSDIAVTILGGRLSKTEERILFHWGQGILY